MNRPSDVVRFIAKAFPNGLPGTTHRGEVVPQASWTGKHAGFAAVILKRVDTVDPRLLREHLTVQKLDMLSESVETLRVAVTTWTSGHLGHSIPAHHLVVIHAFLGECKDEATPVSVDDLPYITDPKLKEDVARDLESLPRLLANKEWKAATVIGGSVLEAILLAKVEEKHAEAIALATAKNWKREGKVLDPADWRLEKLIQGAKELNIIRDQEATTCGVAQHYRNTIHPGVARVRDLPNEGTAYLAVGAAKTLIAKWK